jgi:uncharacterized surface anchored protein
VTITNLGTSAGRTATTDQNGAYSVPNLEPTSYKIVSEPQGFQSKTVEKVTLAARDTHGRFEVRPHRAHRHDAGWPGDQRSESSNYDVPNTNFNTANFGRIANVQSAEGAGPRTMQLALRMTF